MIVAPWVPSAGGLISVWARRDAGCVVPSPLLECRDMSFELLDRFIEAMLATSKVPGAAVAVVLEGQVAFSKAYGRLNVEDDRPMSVTTRYPIGSTTKAINATLLGTLVQEGQLGWDVGVRNYLPTFELGDPWITASTTVRDLVTMRTGLPRHDWVWFDSELSGSALINRVRYLELSCGFRERFQYNNLTTAVAGHVAEVVTGRTWADLVREQIVEPLEMSSTTFSRPPDDVTEGHRESPDRLLRVTKRLRFDAVAPAGGVIHSTIADMAKWVAFNLGRAGRASSIVSSEILSHIHSPQIAAGDDRTAPTRHAAYGLGWFIDTYNGCERISHGGYHNDVDSHVSIFPNQGIGLVTFTNFGPLRLARTISEHAFDLLVGRPCAESPDQVLGRYENNIASVCDRRNAVPRVAGTTPSHAVKEYVGLFDNRGYGELSLSGSDGELVMHRYTTTIPLTHWHYDAWIPSDHGKFGIDEPNAFDGTNPILFESNASGKISALSVKLEPSVKPIHFQRV